ncbi:hypothetical protein NX862_01965 [Rhodobacter sp. KR11]|jgi:hypothetical protein|uniref:hypothetical protein n=1 Tax=Rhodobacter sp. KR11 TaxID=2974588 RepID=UPI0022216F70|nr:hypothetical protein [Rhodobacter sp. KR11]MCW1917511.1 hypothetical protein [Rhodobacter sp. KR11]
MTKAPKKTPSLKTPAPKASTDKTGVMAALHPEPKSSAAGHPGAKTGSKTGSKGAAGRKS